MAQTDTTSDLPRVHVAAVIIAHKGRVLAAQRAHGELAGGWELPGGKVEPGETSEQAARRECAEELGVSLGALWDFSSVEYDYPDFHLSMDVLMGSLAPGQEPELRVHEGLRWLGRDELLDVAWLPADEGLVRELGLAWDQLFDEMHL